MFKKLTSIALAIVMVLSLCMVFTSCGDETTDNELKGMSESPLAAPTLVKDFEISDDFKIGFIFLHDENSTYDLNFLNAALAAQEALGLSNEQVIIKKNIPETDACYQAAADLVDQGCSVVFANSFGHEDFMIQAAEAFPEVQFCHATGTKAHTVGLSNFQNAFASIYQGRYLAGVAAGLKLNEMIAAGQFSAEEAKIGYIGAFTYAEVMSGYTSFFLGARSVCPTVTMDVQFTGSWFDITEESNAAKALIASGCKLISQHADSMGAPSACEEAGIPDVSYNGSTYDACPETFIVSSAINWAPYYMYIVKCASTGEDIADDWCGGIAEGSVVLSGINLDVAAEGTVEAIEAKIAEFKAGTLNVFDTANFTVNGEALTEYMANVDDDANFEADTQVIADGYFSESTFRSAPYFDLRIDGINLINEKY